MSEYEFFTFSEYMRKDQDLLSPSAEDYMEMIYRLSDKNGFTRVNELVDFFQDYPDLLEMFNDYRNRRSKE